MQAGRGAMCVRLAHTAKVHIDVTDPSIAVLWRPDAAGERGHAWGWAGILSHVGAGCPADNVATGHGAGLCDAPGSRTHAPTS